MPLGEASSVLRLHRVLCESVTEKRTRESNVLVSYCTRRREQGGPRPREGSILEEEEEVEDGNQENQSCAFGQ